MVCFAILAFAYKIDFPPFMVLIIVFLNYAAIIAFLRDSVLPSSTPEICNFDVIVAYAVAYGVYLTASTQVASPLSLFETKRLTLGLQHRAGISYYQHDILI